MKCTSIKIVTEWGEVYLVQYFVTSFLSWNHHCPIWAQHQERKLRCQKRLCWTSNIVIGGFHLLMQRTRATKRWKDTFVQYLMTSCLFRNHLLPKERVQHTRPLLYRNGLLVERQLCHSWMNPLRYWNKVKNKGQQRSWRILCSIIQNIIACHIRNITLLRNGSNNITPITSWLRGTANLVIGCMPLTWNY